MIWIIITVAIIVIVTFLLGYGIGRMSLTPIVPEDEE